MASEETVNIELPDGTNFVIISKTSNGTQAVTIPEMNVIRKAFVSCRSSYIATVASGGISGNTIAISWYDPSSGIITSGLGVSGSIIEIMAIGT